MRSLPFLGIVDEQLELEFKGTISNKLHPQPESCQLIDCFSSCAPKRAYTPDSPLGPEPATQQVCNKDFSEEGRIILVLQEWSASLLAQGTATSSLAGRVPALGRQLPGIPCRQLFPRAALGLRAERGAQLQLCPPFAPIRGREVSRKWI